MRRIAAFLAVAAMFSVAPISGGPPPDEPSITLGATRLTLGMEQEKVLNDLRRQFTVRQTDLGAGRESAPVFDLVSKQGPPYRYFGAVQFLDGKLIAINKDWTFGDETSIEDVGRVVYGAVSNLLGAQGQCMVTTGVNVGTMSDSKNITLNCNAKSLLISFARIKGQDSLGVTETLIAPPSRPAH